MNWTMIIFFVIVVGIPVVIGVGGDVMKRWIRFKERQLELTSAHTAEKAAQYAAHTERLEQRVRVLERIVTDKGIDLSDEIERLRDDRPH
jgi:hypothetical protein